ncbi:hypothetical protein MRX96_001517 [Rhipicephalus microplus]
MPKVVYSQKFRTEWLKDPLISKWLSAKCLVMENKLRRASTAAVNSAADIRNLKAHANIKNHRELVGSSSIQKQLGLSFTTKRQVQPGNAAEGRTALFIAEHSSIMTADHLCKLYKKSFPDSEAARAYRMRHSKCASVIKNVLGLHFKVDLVQDIGNSYYTLIIDESTDISVTKFPAISIIYHSVTKSRIMTTFLNLCTLKVYACSENPFAELAGFAMSMLVLPYSNAEVERRFSQLNILKSKLKNKLKPETTNAILIVRAGLKRHQKSCFDYEHPAAVVSAIGTSATYVQPSHLSGPSTSTSGPVEMVSDKNSGDEDLDVFLVDL